MLISRNPCAYTLTGDVINNDVCIRIGMGAIVRAHAPIHVHMVLQSGPK